LRKKTTVDNLITTATSRDEARRAADLAVLPVGSFEQHDDYLPLITDTLIACTSSVARSIRLDLTTRCCV
jgi:creatinine amidohydrolase